MFILMFVFSDLNVQLFLLLLFMSHVRVAGWLSVSKNVKTPRISLFIYFLLHLYIHCPHISHPLAVVSSSNSLLSPSLLHEEQQKRRFGLRSVNLALAVEPSHV